MEKVSRLLLVGWALIGLVTRAQPVYGLGADDGLTEVSLQLQWHHQFQFAGYYAAAEKGYYAEEGLRVEIRAGGYDAEGRAVRPVEEVVFERADFGSTRADLLLHYARGLPVVVLADVMQHSPLVFLTLEEYGLRRLEDIGDRPISLNLPEKGKPKRIDVETLASLQLAGVDPARLNNSMPSWDLNDLLTGKTQLMPAFDTDEPYCVRKAGREPVVIRPSEYGLDFYGDLLFTSRDLIDRAPELVAGFRRASLRGWRYAMDHPQEIVRSILAKYPTRGPDYDQAFLLAEAEALRPYLEADLVDIGYINPARWNRIAQTYQGLGLIRAVDLDGFLYRPAIEAGVTWERLRYWLWGGLLGLVLAGLTIGVLAYVNLRLKGEIARRRRAEARLRVEAENDHLTGLDNRRKFQRDSKREFSRARRYRHALTMLIFDVDFFKRINDRYGHPGGDAVLVALAGKTKALLRESDRFSRIGGEEFAVLLPNTSKTDVRALCERILETNRNNAVAYGGETIGYTVSIGVAQMEPGDGICDDLFLRCDQALYEAKDTGRDRIVVQ